MYSPGTPVQCSGTPLDGTPLDVTAVAAAGMSALAPRPSWAPVGLFGTVASVAHVLRFAFGRGVSCAKNVAGSLLH